MNQLSSTLYGDIKWYLAYEVLYFELAEPSVQQEYEVWENHVLIKADNPDEAYEKAMQHGFDTEHEILINGQKGYLKFKGLKKLVKIYEDLEDGSEIEWFEYSLDKGKLDALVPMKEELHAFQPLPLEEGS